MRLRIPSLERVLPFPRDLAAAAALRDLGALLRGEPPGGITRHEARVRRDVAGIRRRLAAGDAARAADAAGVLAAAHPGHEQVLRLLLAAQEAAGRRGPALRTVRQLRRIADTPAMANLEVRLAGRTLVTETGWVPELAPRLVPPGAGAGVVILPPEFAAVGTPTAAFVGRTIAALAAAFAASAGGITVVQAPAAAARRWTGGPSDPPGLSWAAGDLGAAYPPDPPLHRALAHDAWVASSEVAGASPALLVALLVPDGLRGLVVGQALRAATGVPFAVVRGPGGPPATEHPSLAGRLRGADVVVDGASMDPVALETALRPWARGAAGPGTG